MADYHSSSTGSSYASSKPVAASKQDAIELLLSTSRQMRAASESSDTNAVAENVAEESGRTTPNASVAPAAAFFPPKQAGRYYYQGTYSSSARGSSYATGSGFLYLQQQLLDDKTQQLKQQLLSKQSKLLLQTLLEEQEITLPPTNDTTDDVRPWKKQKTIADPALIKTVDSTMSDETILQLARQVPSQMSLLGSILQILDQSHPVPVSARTFLKTCALTVRPGLVPANMDAREMVLAALHFLSSSSSSSSSSTSLLGGATRTTKNEYGLPYIRPVQPVRDLEKRVYEKVGDWTPSSMRMTVWNLEEDVFYKHSSDTLQWMPRCRFSPPIMTSTVEEDLLWLKGHVPVKPKQARTAVAKKKTTATMAVVAEATTSKVEAVDTAKEKKQSEEDPVAVETT